MFLMIFIISSFLGCGNIVTKKRYEITGKKLAQNYIKDKYGFDGEIVDVYLGQETASILDFFPDYDGRVSIKMKYNGKEFYVTTNVQTSDRRCYDNYQMSEILQAVKDKLIKYAGTEPLGFNFHYGKSISANSHGKEYNGIYYICPANNNSVSISPHKSIDVSNWYDNNVDKDKFKLVTPTYNIHSNKISDSSQNYTIYVFYPAQNLDADKHYKIGLNYNNSKTESFDTTATYFVGDYISFKVPQNKIDQNFTIILDYS